MLRRFLPLAALLVASPLPASNGIDLSLNDDAARISVEIDLGQNMMLEGSWLYHQDRGNVVGAGFHVTGLATGGQYPVRAGLGARLLAIDSDVGSRGDGSALPIGGFVTYTIPDYDRFVVGGSIYYAPDVLAFGDVTKYREYNVWGGYSVLRQGQIYLGLRGVKANFEDGPSVSFDTGLHFGLRLRF